MFKGTNVCDRNGSSTSHGICYPSNPQYTKAQANPPLRIVYFYLVSLCGSPVLDHLINFNDMNNFLVFNLILNHINSILHEKFGVNDWKLIRTLNNLLDRLLLIIPEFLLFSILWMNKSGAFSRILGFILILPF